jgi:hypothetical protein
MNIKAYESFKIGRIIKMISKLYNVEEEESLVNEDDFEKLFGF